MRVFYGIVDSSAFNAFVIFTHILPDFGGNRKDKRLKFLKELFISLIVVLAKCRLVTPTTPKVVKQIICSCGILPKVPPAVQNITQHRPSGQKKRFLCPISKDEKYGLTCSRCHNTTCEEHSKMSLISVRSKIFVYCALHYIFQAIKTY